MRMISISRHGNGYWTMVIERWFRAPECVFLEPPKAISQL
jgi:hypothetical protein